MTVKSAIELRRSIRKYADRPVPARVIEQLIRAVALAPSGATPGRGGSSLSGRRKPGTG